MAAVDFGQTMWGRSWLRVVEPISGTPNPQLPRARRLGRDLDVSVGDEAGVIRAEADDRGRTFPVEIMVPKWSDDAYGRAKGLLHAHEGGGVGGELSRTLFDDLVNEDVRIAVPFEQLDYRCSCRSRSSPCVHVLGCIYAAVLAIDERPMIAYELRSPQRADTTAHDSDWVRLDVLSSEGFFG